MPRVERDEFVEPDPPSGEVADGIAHGAAKGRGAGLNPGNRFETIRLHVLSEERDRVRTEEEPSARVVTRVEPDTTRSIINEVDSPDLSFSWTLNPYRGCEHGCVYCYARPGHEYLGMSCGLDFETRIMAKHDAPALFRKHLGSKSWQGEPIMMSGVTDPYQPVERELGITRACLEVAVECRQPVSIITKNRLVTRDLDLLRMLHEHRACAVAISLTSLDNELASKMEPRASSPSARLEAIREISQAGIPVTVMTAPMIPGLNDHELPALLEAASKAGATSAGYVLLRLPHQIKALFLEWLARHVPARAAKVESLLRQTRDGDLYESSWGTRLKGRGPIAARIRTCFDVFAKRHGLDGRRQSLNSSAFLKPREDRSQGLLFGD
jgi:DNA repair photolyase